MLMKLKSALHAGDLAFKARSDLVEAVLKSHLTSNYGVAGLLGILTYFHVCCVSSSPRALYLAAIWGFETASSPFQKP